MSDFNYAQNPDVILVNKRDYTSGVAAMFIVERLRTAYMNSQYGIDETTCKAFFGPKVQPTEKKADPETERAAVLKKATDAIDRTLELLKKMEFRAEEDA